MAEQNQKVRKDQREKNKAVQEERKKAKAAEKEKKANAVAQEEKEQDKGKYDSKVRSSQIKICVGVNLPLHRCPASTLT